MKRRIWSLQGLLMILGCLACTNGHGVENKAEVTVPVTTVSPPEGNTTFLGGKTWCVAILGASQADLQIALDWACGVGMADCSPIQAGGPCYQPDNLVSHASYAFNNYYQQNGNNDIACNFGGTATLTKHNPSYGKCQYAVSGPSTSYATKEIHVEMITPPILFMLFLTICCLFS